MSTCEGCHGFGGNWDCNGENDPDSCNCENCTGLPGCPECEDGDEINRQYREGEDV